MIACCSYSSDLQRGLRSALSFHSTKDRTEDQNRCGSTLFKRSQLRPIPVFGNQMVRGSLDRYLGSEAEANLSSFVLGRFLRT